jgi:hypothetical protein
LNYANLEVQLAKDWATVLREQSQRRLENAKEISDFRYEQGYLAALRRLDRFLEDPVGETKGLTEPQGSLEGSRE